MQPTSKQFAAALYFAVGFSPITALALSLLDLIPLSLGIIVLVLPALACGLFYGLADRKRGALALTGLLFGIASVFAYDLTARFPFIFAGVMSDFIPRINAWIVGLPESDWRLGYAWRYLGNGGGMGLAFTVVYTLLRPRLDARVAGILYGLAIWSCLMITLRLAPGGESKLFALNPFTFTISLSGHLVYGLALGALVRALLQRQRSAGREPLIDAGPPAI